MNDNISEKDKKDWHKFINSTEKLPNKDFKNQKNKNQKVRSIDLHGYTLDEANKTIEAFINKAFSENINKLAIVTSSFPLKLYSFLIGALNSNASIALTISLP